MKLCEQICKTCPFRRDSPRLGHAEGVRVQQTHGWYGFEPLMCDGAVCLGQGIYLLQARVTHRLQAPQEIIDEINEYDFMYELIFDGNGEMVRYHLGEHHGSKEWYEERARRFNSNSDRGQDDRPGSSDDEDSGDGQLGLF